MVDKPFKSISTDIPEISLQIKIFYIEMNKKVFRN